MIYICIVIQNELLFLTTELLKSKKCLCPSCVVMSWVTEEMQLIACMSEWRWSYQAWGTLVGLELRRLSWM